MQVTSSYYPWRRSAALQLWRPNRGSSPKVMPNALLRILVQVGCVACAPLCISVAGAECRVVEIVGILTYLGTLRLPMSSFVSTVTIHSSLRIPDILYRE